VTTECFGGGLSELQRSMATPIGPFSMAFLTFVLAADVQAKCASSSVPTGDFQMPRSYRSGAMATDETKSSRADAVASDRSATVAALAGVGWYGSLFHTQITRGSLRRSQLSDWQPISIHQRYIRFPSPAPPVLLASLYPAAIACRYCSDSDRLGASEASRFVVEGRSCPAT
jgi:hypothetical protein